MAIVLLLLALDVGRPTPSGNRVAGLEATIRLNKRVYPAGVKLRVALSIRNRSRKMVRLHRILMVDSNTHDRSMFWPGGQAEIHVRRLAGRHARKRFSGAIGGRIEEDNPWLHLAPGDELNKNVSLMIALTPGYYEVRVIYRASKGNIPGANKDLVSNPIRFTVR